MTMQYPNHFHSTIIDITEDYLGPAAPRFVSRIATNHLGKPVARLTRKDLPELITWVRLAANIMSENTDAIEEYVHRLEALRDTPASSSPKAEQPDTHKLTR